MNEKINLPELAALLAEKAEITKKEAETFLRDFFGLLSESLVESDQVKIKDFGTFKRIKVEDRESVNVRTGERVLIPAHQKISFSTSGQLSETVNEPFALFEPVELDPADQIKAQEGITAETAVDYDIDDPDMDREDIPEAEQSEIQPLSAERGIYPEPVVSADIPESIVHAPAENTSTDKTDESETKTIPPQKKKKRSTWLNIFLITLILLLLTAGIAVLLWYTNPRFRTTADSFIKTINVSFNQDKDSNKGETIPMNEAKQTENAEKKISPETIDSTTVAPPVSHEIQEAENIEPKTVQPAKEQTPPEDKVQTLQDGQRLTLIALKEYGNKIFWVYIYEENKNMLESPHRIPIGTKLKIPPAQKYSIDKDNPESVSKARALAKKYE